ncbi:MAG: hypothetical protein ACF8SC_01880 [Phycisphaerales bacterium JB037]
MSRTDLGDRLPEGFVGVPLVGASAGGTSGATGSDGTVRVCVVCARRADAIGGHLITLGEGPVWRTHLGALLDAGDRVVAWVEILVQHFEGLESTTPAYREALTNASLDRRWAGMVEAADRVTDRGFVRTGFESRPGPACWIDPGRGAMVEAVSPEGGQRLVLCEDEGLLKEMGLPGYGTTLARYLWSPELGLDQRFVAATSGTPVEGSARRIEEIVPEDAGLVAFNPAAGRIAVRQLAALSYEDLLDVLGGGDWEGPRHGRLAAPFQSANNGSGNGGGGNGQTGADHLRPATEFLLHRQGTRGRLIEALHLKLRAWAMAVESAWAATAATGRPLLNLTAESFRVDLAEPGVGLPAWWASRVVLTTPGDAAELALRGVDAKFYLPASADRGGVYRPRLDQSGQRGQGSFRVRRVMDGGDGGSIVEATFQTQDLFTPRPSDLVWFVVTAGDHRVDLYAKVDRDSAMSGSEWRVRTLEHRLGDAAFGIKSAEGVSMSGVPFEVVPQLSSPADLHALGVLGVRSLLVDQDTTLAVAVDEVLSLAREAGGRAEDGRLASVIAGLFAEDGRWGKSLGPQRLLGESLGSGEAFGAVPGDLWFDVLALLCRVFPGAHPESVARDPGDARAGGLAGVYEPVRRELRHLLARSESLIVVDWTSNREINAVIRRVKSGLAGSAAQ